MSENSLLKKVNQGTVKSWCVNKCPQGGGVFSMSAQRRTYGFGTPDPAQHAFPRIAPPPGLLTGRQIDEKQSRYTPRSLVFTHRIWVLVTVVIFVFLCMKVLSPPMEQPSHIYSNVKLVPRDYLNISKDSPPPFDFCPVYGPGDTLAQKYGAHALSRARLHAGSGARVQKVIKRALSGQPVTISVLGGSSTCPAISLLTSGCSRGTPNSQYLRAMVRAMTQSRRHVIHRDFSSGGTTSSPTQPPS